MKVLVDTCVWSEVLRKKQPNLQLAKKLKDLIKDGRVSIIGPIRQEILSGISVLQIFKSLKNKLSAFEDTLLTTEHFTKAAEFNNTCRTKGVQGSSTDFLICSVSFIESLYILTTDNDFNNYKKYLPINVFKE